MSMLTNLDLIRRVPLFSMMTASQAETLAGAVAKQRFKRGEMIVEQGSKSNALSIILSGKARVLMTDSKSREVILASLNPGDYIGEMSLIDNEPHSANVEAEVQTDVLVLGRDAFTRCLAENTSISFAVMNGLVKRLRNADRKIGSLALMGVYGLLEYAALDDRNQMIIRDKISRQDIAKMVGASREMVSRVMKDFEEQGFIETQENGAILVKDRRKVPR
jgi:CRP/FNR family transcriptional regulator, cyclic AMP receptor protein